MDIWNIIVMFVMGAIAGTIATKLMKGSDAGLLVNSLLGIAGAVVGGFLFNLIGITPGQGISKILSDTFGVSLPASFLGTIVSATVGSIVLILVVRTIRGKK